MYKYIALILALSFSSDVLAWSKIRSYSQDSCNSTSNGLDSHYVIGQRSCRFSSTDYVECASAQVSESVSAAEQYISDRHGNAYLYTYSYCQWNDSTRTMFHLGVYRFPNPVDPTDIPPPLDPSIPVYGSPRPDSDCQALGDAGVYNGLTLPVDADGNASFRGCSLQSTGVAVETDDGLVMGDWTSTGSNGQPFYPDTDLEESEPVPSYLTPSPDCQVSCVTIGGQTYEVDQDAIDNGNVSIINPGSGGSDGGSGGSGGSGIDWGDDGGSSGTPGTSTGSDGGPLGMGGGEGDSTLGDIVGAVNRLTTTVRNGFDGLLDGLLDGLIEEDTPDPDALIQGSALQDIDDGMTEALETHDEEVSTLLEQIGEDDSSPIADSVTSYLPDLPSSSCSPLTFGSGPLQFQISCDVFSTIRSWLAWIIYFWSAVTIIDIFFAPATRSR